MIKITFLNSFLCEKGGGGLVLAPPPPLTGREEITEVIWEVEVALVTQRMFEKLSIFSHKKLFKNVILGST